MQQGIQQSDQAVDQLITKLAGLLEQPPPEPQQHQPQREESQQHQPPREESQQHQPPQDDPTWRWWTETQQEYHRSYANAASQLNVSRGETMLSQLSSMSLGWSGQTWRTRASFSEGLRAPNYKSRREFKKRGGSPALTLLLRLSGNASVLHVRVA